MGHWPDFLELDNLKIESKSIMIGSQSTDKLLKKEIELCYVFLTIESTVHMGSFFLNILLLRK